MNDTVVTTFLKLLESALNYPFVLLAIGLFLLLLCGSLLASGIAIACDSRNEKKEQENRRLARALEHYEKSVLPVDNSLEKIQ